MTDVLGRLVVSLRRMHLANRNVPTPFMVEFVFVGDLWP